MIAIPEVQEDLELKAEAIDYINWLALPNEPDYKAYNPRYTQSYPIRPSFHQYESTVEAVENACRVLMDRVLGNYKSSGAVLRTAIRGLIEHYPLLKECNLSGKQQAKKTPAQKEPEPETPLIPPLAYSRLDQSLASGACKWLDDYVKFSKIWSPRSPEIYHVACGLWLLSTITLGRVAAINAGVQYPGLQFMIVGSSQIWGKTTCCKVAKGVLSALHLQWMLPTDRCTPESFLSSMAGTLPTNYAKLTDEQKEEVRKQISFAGKRAWYFSEARALIKDVVNEKGRNAAFKEILQQVADNENYRNATLLRGIEAIDNPYLAFLSTLTPDCIKMYEKGDMSERWTDGFYARFLFASVTDMVEKTREQLEREERPEGEILYPASLIKPLAELDQRLGYPLCNIVEELDEQGKGTGKYKPERLEEPPLHKLSLTREARRALNDYNNDLTLIAQKPAFTQVRSHYGRLATYCLQMATLFAALENRPTPALAGTLFDAPMIELRHIALAQRYCEMFRASLHELVAYLHTDSSGVEKENPLEAKIKKALREHGPLTVNELSTKWLKAPLKPIIDTINILCYAGIVELQPKEEGKRGKPCKRYALIDD